MLFRSFVAMSVLLAGWVAHAPRASAQPQQGGGIRVESPWIRATPGGAVVAAGYGRIVNTGTAPDRLLSAAIPVAGGGEVHETMNHGGMAAMGPVPGGLTIPAGESVTLAPGGWHLMFTRLSAPVRAGDTVRGTLTFEKAGVVTVEFAVAPAGAKGPETGHAH